jgi:MerR family transcriptional regulator, light-induced transcriptional regulator
MVLSSIINRRRAVRQLQATSDGGSGEKTTTGALSLAASAAAGGKPMSTIRPLTELKRYWTDCSIGDWSIRLNRSQHASPDRELSRVERNVLHRTIEAEIVPRLLLAHSGQGTKLAADLNISPTITVEEVEAFTQVLLSGNIYAAKAFVLTLRKRGVPLDIVLLWLFAPSARYLGELWDQDVCDFVDVTVALSKLQQLLRDLDPENDEDQFPLATQKRAFLAVMPGDQHTFGLFIVQEFFRRAGWYVCGGSCDTTEELLNLAHSEPFDVVGLSVGIDAPKSALSDLMVSLRKSALNRDVRMMVGGRFFLKNPQLVACIGADATAPDGRRAVSSFPTCLT